jgi:predicted HTH domain antitoxin
MLNVSTDDFEKEAKLALAVKLFELGRLTSGQAAQVAEISRSAFLLSCSRYGAPSVQWDDEELMAEFGDMKKLSERALA